MNKNTSSIAENDHVIYHNKEKIIAEYKKDPTRVVNDLVHSISIFLSVEVEPVSYSKYRRSFELDCRKAVTGILLSQFEKESLFLIFPDIIPGFTTLTYKKDSKYFTQNSVDNKESKSKLVSEAKALAKGEKSSKAAKNTASTANSQSAGSSANHIFNSFFQKNSQLVLLVESEEILMMFCPVSDFDKYIKQLDAYSLS